MKRMLKLEAELICRETKKMAVSNSRSSSQFAPLLCHEFMGYIRLGKWLLRTHRVAQTVTTTPVYFMRTHHPTGTLPLAVMITSSKSQATLESCLDSLTKVLPDNAFGGKGLEQGPTIMLTDDDSAQRQTIRMTIFQNKQEAPTKGNQSVDLKPMSRL